MEKERNIFGGVVTWDKVKRFIKERLESAEERLEKANKRLASGKLTDEDIDEIISNFIPAAGIMVNPARKAGGDIWGAFSALWDKGVRKEIDDSLARIKGGFSGVRTTKLGDLLEHPELYEYYPEAKSIPVYVRPSPPDWESGGYSSYPRRILAEAPDENSLIGILLHELQHYIQDLEGWYMGGMPGHFTGKGLTPEKAEIKEEIFQQLLKQKKGENPMMYQEVFYPARTSRERLKSLDKMSAYEAYRRLAGEIEAKSTQDRYLHPLLKRVEMPYESQDVPLEGVAWLTHGGLFAKKLSKELERRHAESIAEKTGTPLEEILEKLKLQKAIRE